MDFHQGNGPRRLQLFIHPQHRQAGDGRDGLEGRLLAVGHEVTHFAAIGHAGQECVLSAQMISFLHIARDAAQGFHVIDFPPLLEGITHVPAGLPLRVFQSLGKTDGKTMAVGSRQYGILAPDACAIAVQDEFQRCVFRQAVGQIHGEVPHVAVYLERIVDKAARMARQCRQGQRQRRQDIFEQSFHDSYVQGSSKTLRAWTVPSLR